MHYIQSLSYFFCICNSQRYPRFQTILIQRSRYQDTISIFEYLEILDSFVAYSLHLAPKTTAAGTMHQHQLKATNIYEMVWNEQEISYQSFDHKSTYNPQWPR